MQAADRSLARTSAAANGVRIALLTLVALCSLGVAQAQDAPAATHARVAAATTVSLAVTGAVDKPLLLNEEALRALPATQATVDGHLLTGIDLHVLLDRVAGLKVDKAVKNADLSMVVVAIGSDGYRAVFSLGELDPAFGNRRVMVVYAIDGVPLGDQGLTRLYVPGDGKRGRAVDHLASLDVIDTSPR